MTPDEAVAILLDNVPERDRREVSDKWRDICISAQPATFWTGYQAALQDIENLT